MKDNLTGDKFGKITVLNLDHIDYQGYRYWLCQCDCGAVHICDELTLSLGYINVCECERVKEKKHILRSESLINKRFGRLVVLDYDHTDIRGFSYWLCQCDCGNQKVINGANLKNGKTTSCGCYQKERSTKHGMRYSRLYKIWENMRQRCNNPCSNGYERYGGRGIGVCEEWETSFENFRDWALNNGYEEHLSIDRINVYGDYCPNNCRFVDRLIQNNNRRSNRRILYHGEDHTISEWARILNVNSSTLRCRINRDDYSDFYYYFN